MFYAHAQSGGIDETASVLYACQMERQTKSSNQCLAIIEIHSVTPVSNVVESLNFFFLEEIIAILCIIDNFIWI